MSFFLARKVNNCILQLHISFLFENYYHRNKTLMILKWEHISVLLSGSLANSNIRNKNILISHKHKLIPYLKHIHKE